MTLHDMGDSPDPKQGPNDESEAGTNPLNGRQTADRNEQVQRRERDMIELRIGGASVAAIAEHYKLAESTVSTVIKRGMLRMKRDRLELREQAHARLDKIVRAFYEDAVGMPKPDPSTDKPVPREPDPKAAGVVVMAVREQIKLGQLDKLEDDDGPSETPAQRADRVAETMSSYLQGVHDTEQRQSTTKDAKGSNVGT